MSDSEISYRTGGGASFVGPDAVNLYRAKTLAVALSLYVRTGLIPNRNVTPARMLVLATEYTGKTYKRGQHREAFMDVHAWCKTMEIAIPTTVDGKAV